MVAILIPVGIILLAQIWIRSFCDAAYGILGLAYSLVTGTFMIVVLKKTIGGLRPHFLSVCQPVIPDTNIGKGFQNVMFTIEQVSMQVQVATQADKNRFAPATRLIFLQRLSLSLLDTPRSPLLGCFTYRKFQSNCINGVANEADYTCSLT